MKRHAFFDGDEEHAKLVRREAQQEGVKIQADAMQGKISKAEANSLLRQVNARMRRRSSRVALALVSEFLDEAADDH